MSVTLLWPGPNPPAPDLLRRSAIDRLVTDPAQLQAAPALWPGIRRPASRRGRDIEVASASREPWIDSNLYLPAWRRALQQAPALLYPTPNDAKPSLLPLLETKLSGADLILDQLPPPAFGPLAQWLQQNSALCGLPAPPNVTALLDGKPASRELANLLFRRGLSPRLLSTAQVPAPDPKIFALVAASLDRVPDSAFAHAQAGATVVVDSPPPPTAKLVKQESDRAFFEYGRGRIVAYSKRIADPSEFALDVIDLITHKRRPCRLWNAPSAIAFASANVAYVLNYGDPRPDAEIQLHLHGHFSRAELFTPDQPPQPLPTARRAFSTEVFLNRLIHLAIVRFT